ncbi:MAG: N(4)-(beta-N-acetylglucosaminyl)-L-asparaginase [Salinibacter sp.]
MPPPPAFQSQESGADAANASPRAPVVVSTWPHGMPANEAAWTVLADGGAALDAVEAGVAVTEADPEARTVGRGGYPDRTGVVTLDACVMDEQGRCGAVAALQDILHPTAVARAVMEETPHVLLVGEGARAFARDQGFDTTTLLTDQSKQDWRAWRHEQAEGTAAGGGARPEPNVEKAAGRGNHDTIGMLALDAEGRLSGACTTSGTKWKMHGRVGDSPLIGAGLYVDDEVGAACATGWGEAIIRVAGAHLAVEAMRQGAAPTAACQRVVERIRALPTDTSDIQVGVVALTPEGEIGTYALRPGFEAGRRTPDAGNHLVEADHLDDESASQS